MEEIAKKDMIISNVIAGDFTSFFLFCLIFILIFCFHELFFFHFKCDCRWTPFKGPICADEIGINMRTDNMIVYEFKGNYKSTIAEKLHVGFTTTDPKGFLIGLYR